MRRIPRRLRKKRPEGEKKGPATQKSEVKNKEGTQKEEILQGSDKKVLHGIAENFRNNLPPDKQKIFDSAVTKIDALSPDALKILRELPGDNAFTPTVNNILNMMDPEDRGKN
jgi:hypothetical protein